VRRCFFSSSSSSSSSSLCVFFACFLARASRVCLAFSSPRARFESIEEQRERLRCIVHQKNSDRKKSDLDVGLSRIGPTKPPRASQKVTMDRAKSIDRRVPMTQQSSNEYACPCFFVCVCARKSACASNPPGCFLYEDSPKATLLFLPFVFDNNNNNNNNDKQWKSRTKTGKNS